MAVRLAALGVAVMAVAPWFPAAAADQQVRVFQLHFRPAREAALLVEPLLSAEGSLLLQPKLNAITVRDSAAVLERVAVALAAWDVAPANYTIRLRVLLASTTPPTPGPAAPLISGVGSELQQLFRFTSYSELDTLVVTAADGSTVEAAVADRYHIRFAVRAVPQDAERLQLAQLEFTRRVAVDGGAEKLQPLLRTTLSLRTGQTFVLGAARSEEANRALVLVVLAEREVPR